MILAGVQAGEYALHSARIRGATNLSAGCAYVQIFYRIGRRASVVYTWYTRGHGRDAQWVSGATAERGEG